MNIKNIMKDAFVLLVITIVAGFALGWVHQITLEPIQNERDKRKNEAYLKVAPMGKEFEPILSEYYQLSFDEIDESLGAMKYLVLNEVVNVKDETGESIGQVVNLTTAEGYQGGIQIVVGIGEKGEVSGISILRISETAGLGMNALKPEFYGQFKSENEAEIVEEFKVVKDKNAPYGEIDALSGATITSNAVVNEVNGALAFYRYAGGGLDE